MIYSRSKKVDTVFLEAEHGIEEESALGKEPDRKIVLPASLHVLELRW